MTTSEPALLDTNVLVNALFEDSEHFSVARALVERAKGGETGFRLLPQNITEFYAVVTNPKVATAHFAVLSGHLRWCRPGKGRLYKQLHRAEQAWRSLKSGLRMRPMFHWAVHRIHAHVAITVLALLVERVIEHACADTWRNIHDDLRQIKVAHFSTPNGAVWQVTEPRPESRNRLKSLNIPLPPTILKVG